jgi:hypothetical protein
MLFASLIVCDLLSQPVELLYKGSSRRLADSSLATEYLSVHITKDTHRIVRPMADELRPVAVPVINRLIPIFERLGAPPTLVRIEDVREVRPEIATRTSGSMLTTTRWDLARRYESAQEHR